MAQKKKESREYNPLEKEMLEELQKEFNRQINETFIRVQKDYGSVGTKMAESVNAILDDQDFVNFMILFYDGSRLRMANPTWSDEGEAYAVTMPSELFFFKWQSQLPVNVPCHIEDVLAGDRFLRRFMRELFLDTYKAKMAMKTPQNQ